MNLTFTPMQPNDVYSIEDYKEEIECSQKLCAALHDFLTINARQTLKDLEKQKLQNQIEKN